MSTKITSSHCIETCEPCEAPQLARNHYFTGKLLVERDFTDEQRYHMGKMQRHNRVLHGWGTACGLRVKQHPNEQCRDRFVIVEPGIAFDCCGREVVIRCEETFDFRRTFLERWREAQAEAGTPVAQDAVPSDAHTFQICLRYRECPTEEVPALFDECGCSDGVCEPNRILESFELDLLLDPEAPDGGVAGRRLDWKCTLNLAHAFAVAPHESSDRIYVVAGQSDPTLYALSAGTQQVLASRSLVDQEPLDLAVSVDGAHLYLATVPAGATDPEIRVLESSDLSAPPVSVLTMSGAGVGAVRLAATADGRLWAASPEEDHVLLWGSDIHGGGSPAPPQEIAVGSRPVDLAAGSDGGFVYVANLDGADVSAIDQADPTQVTSLALGAGVRPVALGVASTVFGDNLAVIDADAGRLYLLGHRPDEAQPGVMIGTPVEGLAHPPIDVVISPAGAWAYVLVQDNADERGYLQSVDLHDVEQGLEDPLGPALFVGERPRRIALGAGGSRLYVAYAGDDEPDTGGVAVLEALAEECCDFGRTLDPCPDCSDGGECLVLATVENYELDDQVVDPPADDTALPADRVPLDNRKGRRILASTQLLTEIVQCLCERGGAGEPGEPGPPGQPGQTGQPGQPGADGDDGLGIDDVTVEFVACDEPGGARIVEGDPRVLELTIPTSCGQDLTHVCAVSWQHGGTLTAGELSLSGFFPNFGDQQQFLDEVQQVVGPEVFKTYDLQEGESNALVVAFDRRIRGGDVHRFSLRLLAAVQDRTTGAVIQPAPWTWVELHALPIGAHLKLTETEDGNLCSIEGIHHPLANPDEPVNGAVLLVSMNSLRVPHYRVELRGDFVRDTNGISVDGNHLAPWIHKRPSGDGIAGGLFESWFRLAQFNPNFASVNELESVEGLTRSMAERIVAHREESGPFTSLEDLTSISGIGEATLRRVQSSLTLLHPDLDRAFRVSMGDQ